MNTFLKVLINSPVLPIFIFESIVGDEHLGVEGAEFFDPFSANKGIPFFCCGVGMGDAAEMRFDEELLLLFVNAFKWLILREINIDPYFSLLLKPLDSIW